MRPAFNGNNVWAQAYRTPREHKNYEEESRKPAAAGVSPHGHGQGHDGAVRSQPRGYVHVCARHSPRPRSHSNCLGPNAHAPRFCVPVLPGRRLAARHRHDALRPHAPVVGQTGRPLFRRTHLLQPPVSERSGQAQDSPPVQRYRNASHSCRGCGHGPSIQGVNGALYAGRSSSKAHFGLFHWRRGHDRGRGGGSLANGGP